jgi:hypothetical protein
MAEQMKIRLKQLGKTIAFMAIGALAVYIFRDKLQLPVGYVIFPLAVLLYVHFRLDNIEQRVGFDQLEPEHAKLNRWDAVATTPNHQKPSLPEEGWGIDEVVKLFFSNFDSFANVINECLKETAWRIEETPETDIAVLGDDGPVIGRKYKINYGSHLSGELRLTNSYDYSLDKPNIQTTLNLFSARFFDSYTINELVGWLIFLTSGGTVQEQEHARNELYRAMTESMWKVGTEVVSNNNLELKLVGSARSYLIRTGVIPGYKFENSRKQRRESP